MPEVWMGGLEPWMDDNFIATVLAKSGISVQRIKRIVKQNYSKPAEYCFLEFASQSQAEAAVNTLNGQPMDVPLGYPSKTWKLNWGSRNAGAQSQTTDHSIFVGDLSQEVNEQMLLTFFQERYFSVTKATVQTNFDGTCKGYGFVRFGAKTEQIRALQEMQGAVGCGSKPIRVNEATPKNSNNNNSNRHHMNPNPYVQPMHMMQGYPAATVRYNPGGGAGYYQQHQSVWQQQHPHHYHAPPQATTVVPRVPLAPVPATVRGGPPVQQQQQQHQQRAMPPSSMVMGFSSGTTPQHPPQTYISPGSGPIPQKSGDHAPSEYMGKMNDLEDEIQKTLYSITS